MKRPALGPLLRAVLWKAGWIFGLLVMGASLSMAAGAESSSSAPTSTPTPTSSSAPPSTPAPPSAFTSSSANTGPVSITADALEYHETEGTYVARGHADVVRGGVTLSADLITAHVAPLPDGSTDLTQATAEGNVVITSGQNKVTGEQGLYEVAKSVILLKGRNLRLTTPQDTITARDSLEYWEKQRLAVARGQAVAVRGDRRVAADTLTALLEENAQKELDVRRIGAEGHVVITTPTDIAQGDKGAYDVKGQKALLEGNVRLTRGDNQLNGARAEINMATGISRLLAGGAGQRVQGLLSPKDAPGGKENGKGP